MRSCLWSVFIPRLKLFYSVMNQKPPMDNHPTISPRLQTSATSNEAPQSNAEPQRNARRIPALDGLRGVAIFLVVCQHYLGDSGGGEFGSLLYRFRQLFRLGWTGVDLFFVLSGFLIGGILLQARDSENYYRVFYLRRVHRILPIYYLWILLAVLIGTAVPHWIPNTIPSAAVGIRSIPIYFLFLQNFPFYHSNSFYWYWLGVTWSLAVEEQFYLIAPLLIRSLSRVSLIVTLGATVVLAPVLREFVYRFLPQSLYWYTVMPCRADSLAVGMLAALAWKGDGIRAFLLARTKSVYRVLIFFACGIPILLKYFPGPWVHFTAVFGFSWLAFFYVTVLFAVLIDPNGTLARIMRWRWLMKLGGVSYCVYLIHLPINGMLHGFLLRSTPSIASLPGIGVTLLAAVLTFGLAALSWEYFEGPMVRLGHRYQYSLRTRISPAPVTIPGVGQAGIGGSVKQG